jgi:rhodanese-related sulfurtransferase
MAIGSANSFLWRVVVASDVHVTIFTAPNDANAPGVAAHLAILHEAARDVRLEVDFDVLAAVRARYDKIVVHCAIPRRSLRTVQ